MNLTNPFRGQIGQILDDTFDLILAKINAVWNVEHNSDGTHAAVTATTVTTTGDISGAADGVFEGDVIAQDGSGEEVAIGTVASVNGTSVLSGEVSRKGVLIGGPTNGFFLEYRAAASPFLSGRELVLWGLNYSTTLPLLRIGVDLGTPTIIDGGTGTALQIGMSGLGTGASGVNPSGYFAVLESEGASNINGLAVAQADSVVRAQSSETVTVANAAVVSLGDDTRAGFLFITDSGDGAALFNLAGSNHAAIEVSDPNTTYSHTAGTGSSTNIYWSAGNSRYELQNNSGASATYQLVLIGN